MKFLQMNTYTSYYQTLYINPSFMFNTVLLVQSYNTNLIEIICIFVNILWIHKYVDKGHLDENINKIIKYEGLVDENDTWLS